MAQCVRIVGTVGRVSLHSSDCLARSSWQGPRSNWEVKCAGPDQWCTWPGTGVITTQQQCKSGQAKGRRLDLNAASRKVGEPLLSLLPTVSLTASRLSEASQTVLLWRAGLGHWQLSTQRQARVAKLTCLTDNGELYRTSIFYQEQKQLILSSKQDQKKPTCLPSMVPVGRKEMCFVSS